MSKTLLSFAMTIALLSVGPTTASAFVITANPNLPPDIGAYRTSAGAQTTYHPPGLTIVLENIILQPDASTATWIWIGPDEQENFNATLSGEISVNGGPLQPITGTGLVATMAYGKAGNVTGTFSTEMLQMDISASSPLGPILIRESPTLVSSGQTTVADTGGGVYRIDSFFDVFTELSVDDGNLWNPSDTSTHVDLGPGSSVDCVCGGVFSVGQRVYAIVNNPAGNSEITLGLGGTVRGGTSVSPSLLVEWDGITNGHDGNGFCECPSGCSANAPRGWYVECSDIGDTAPDTPTSTPTDTSTSTPTDTLTSTPLDTATPTPTATSATALCAPAPLSVCAVPTKGVLKLIGNTADPTKQKLIWKWINGTADLADFDDPINGTTNYRLCVYDDGALVMSPAVAEGGTCDGNPCWVPLGTIGYKYKNKLGNVDGMTFLKLKSGVGKAKIIAKGKGTSLLLPFPVTDATALTVQLVQNPGAGGRCWEVTYPSPPFVEDPAKPKLIDKVP